MLPRLVGRNKPEHAYCSENLVRGTPELGAHGGAQATRPGKRLHKHHCPAQLAPVDAMAEVAALATVR